MSAVEDHRSAEWADQLAQELLETYVSGGVEDDVALIAAAHAAATLALARHQAEQNAMLRHVIHRGAVLVQTRGR